MKPMRYISLIIALLSVLGLAAQQQQSQYALYNYRNDGFFNAFLNEEIDSIIYSYIGIDGLEYDNIVTQEVWTQDSIYRIPIAAIDSIGFRAPETRMRDNLFYLRDYHIDYALSVDSLTANFNKTIKNDSLPEVGQVVLCLIKREPFEDGFAGRVTKVNYLEDRIEVVCSQVQPWDVFERLVLVGTGVSNINDYNAGTSHNRSVLRTLDTGIEEIELPEEWKTEWKMDFLDMLSITSKNPRVRYKYYSDVSAFNYYIGGDIFVDHPDLTYKVTFDWEKISKLGEEYKEVKEIWNLFKDGNYDAIQSGEKKKQLEEKEWERKIPIPFEVGPFTCVFEIGGMLKPEAFNIKTNWEMKTSAFHHMGFFAHGHNPLAPSVDGIDESWGVDSSNDWYSKPATSFSWDVSIDGSLSFGVFARLKASLLTRHLLRASVGGEAGIRLSYKGDFKLCDTDCNTPNVYGLLKDSNVGVKLYGKVKGEIGALPFNLIDLEGEVEYPFWEGNFYLFPHFTAPTLTTKLDNISRKFNEEFTTTVSKSMIPLLSCEPGLAFYSDDGSSKWETRKAIYLDDIPYHFESPERDVEFSAYEANLTPGETYRCYPVFKMFGGVWKAGPHTEFTYPMPLTVETSSLNLKKGAQQLVRINGGWGDYIIYCEPEDIVTAAIEKSGNFYQLRITALKEGNTTVKVYDKRSHETASVEVNVSGEITPDPGNHEWVDLGLPSGTLWATCNVGANSPEEYGDYFAWGETEVKAYYYWDNYMCDDDECGTMEDPIYVWNGNKLYADISGSIFDVATSKWGSSWQMPSSIQMNELLSECIWTWCDGDNTKYNGKSVRGYIISSKVNDNKIFLPAAGNYYHDVLLYENRYCLYWSSSQYDGSAFEGEADYNNSNSAYGMDYNYKAIYTDLRYYGQTVRPVRVQKSNEDHAWVDLGLPSGTKWATCNVGANSPEEYGDYFAWGETAPKDEYNWSTYKWMNAGQSDWRQINKYTFDDGQTSGCWYSNGTFVGDGKTELDPEDDAATANWGSGWQMPSYDQITELYNSSYTTTTWTTQNGKSGRLITSNSNGNSIFLPAAGYRDGTSLYDAGSNGSYWSRSFGTGYSDYAYSLYFRSDYIDWYYDNRRYGQSVRPVRVLE